MQKTGHFEFERNFSSWSDGGGHGTHGTVFIILDLTGIMTVKRLECHGGSVFPSYSFYSTFLSALLIEHGSRVAVELVVLFQRTGQIPLAGPKAPIQFQLRTTGPYSS